MMAVNRYRLKSQAQQGHRGAKLTLKLINQTDKLLGVILLGNNLLNAAATSLTTLIAQRIFGIGNETAIFIATTLIAFAIIIFSEATPKVIAATYPQRIAYAASYILSPLLKLFYPLVWSINLIVSGLIKLMRLDISSESAQHTAIDPEELRIMVLESGHLIETKHRSILLNLFELENITVDDVMTPQHLIEMVNIKTEGQLLRQQLSALQHTRLPVYAEHTDNVIGILHTRKILHLLTTDAFEPERLLEILRPPYYIPAGTPLFTQLANFQSNKRRLGLVVDEYGDIKGLVTLEDILEEIIGEFTTHAPNHLGSYRPQSDGSYLIEGTALLRDLNRKLGCHFDLNGPKTLNGLIVDYFEGLPEAGTCLKINQHYLEVVSAQERSVKIVRLQTTYTQH